MWHQRCYHSTTFIKFSLKKEKLPLVVGHEFVGEVVEIGKEVSTYFNIGDRASGEGHIACGR